MKLDFIKQIMSEFDQSNVTKMKVEIDDLKIELEKESEKVEYVKPLEKENKMAQKEIKAQEHLEQTYEIVGTLSKNELKKMNSFQSKRINSKEKEIE